MSKPVKCEADVYAFFGATDRESTQKAIYKNTDCGAWIQFDAEGIAIGSIIEGLDVEVGPYRLNYADGFSEDNIYNLIDMVEGAVQHIMESALVEQVQDREKDEATRNMFAAAALAGAFASGGVRTGKDMEQLALDCCEAAYILMEAMKGEL